MSQYRTELVADHHKTGSASRNSRCSPPPPRPVRLDVTEGYMRKSVEHLRGEAEKVAAFLLERMDAEE
jgi:hypothetical protein